MFNKSRFGCLVKFINYGCMWVMLFILCVKFCDIVEKNI